MPVSGDLALMEPNCREIDKMDQRRPMREPGIAPGRESKKINLVFLEEPIQGEVR